MDVPIIMPGDKVLLVAPMRANTATMGSALEAMEEAETGLKQMYPGVDFQVVFGDTKRPEVVFVYRAPSVPEVPAEEPYVGLKES